MEEQAQAVRVHGVCLGERGRFPDEVTQPLSQRVVEAFNMAGLAHTLARSLVLGPQEEHPYMPSRSR